jgi:Raf kinase inhibitor-like YbhB/YbcL family protein
MGNRIPLPAMNRRAAMIALLLAALVACDTDDGRTLRPPDPSKTTTTSTTTSVAGGVVPSAPATSTPGAGGILPGAPDEFSLVLPWADGAGIPRRYTCDARNQVGPVFNWFVPPDRTAEFAIVVDDPDAPTPAPFVHWVAGGIPASLRTLDASRPQDAVVPVVNDSGSSDWFGPCPPEGDGPHQYRFTLHALRRPLELAPESPASDAIEAIEEASIATASYTGVYSR